MILAVDVMGFENSLDEAILACQDFIKQNKNIEIILVGNEEKIRAIKFNSTNISIINAIDEIEQNDSITILRTKKDSSMFKAINLVKQKKADGVLSAGNSSIFAFLCYQNFGLITGVNKLGFIPYVPTFSGKGFNILDVGASINCDDYDLYIFAIIGNLFAKCRGIDNPKVSILNIGEEHHKGFEYHHLAFDRLKANKNINFQGYIEPKNILMGLTDVIITDGYAGNICLKSLEGTSKIIFNDMLNYYKKPLHWFLFPFIMSYLLKVKKKFDYKNNAGAFVAGINNIAVKTHGSADYKQFFSSLRMLKESVEFKIIDKIKKEILNESKRVKR